MKAKRLRPGRDPIRVGDLAFTPILPSPVRSTGSQWVMQPQEAHRASFSDPSPQAYSSIVPGAAVTCTSLAR